MGGIVIDRRVMYPFVWRGAFLMGWRYGPRAAWAYLRTFRGGR